MARAGRGLSSLANLVFLSAGPNVGGKIFLPYLITSMEKDLKEEIAAAAAIVIECLLVPGPLIIAWYLILTVIL